MNHVNSSYYTIGTLRVIILLSKYMNMHGYILYNLFALTIDTFRTTRYFILFLYS